MTTKNKFAKLASFCIITGALSACNPNPVQNNGTTVTPTPATASTAQSAPKEILNQISTQTAEISNQLLQASSVATASSVALATNTTTNQDSNSSQLSPAIAEVIKVANFKLLSHKPSPLVGFTSVKVEVNEGGKPIHWTLNMSNDGKYFIDTEGRILISNTDTVARDLVSKRHLPEIEKYIGVGFDESKTFKITKGKPIRKLAIFTDPDCPFCKRLEANIANLDNVEITYIYFPVKFLHPDAEEKTNKLWAVEPSKRGEVWQKFIEEGIMPDSNMINLTKYKYDYAYKDKLAAEFDLRATPTMFNIQNGEIMLGSAELGMVEEFLNKDLNKEQLDELKKLEEAKKANTNINNATVITK